MRRLGVVVLGWSVVLAVSCGTSSTERPPILKPVPPVPPGAQPVGYQPLANHLPRIVSHADGGELDAMTLWAMGSDGLRERVFDTDTQQWSAWIRRGLPSDAQHPPVDWDELGKQLSADSGFEHDRDHVAIQYSYNTSGLNTQVKTALPTDESPFGTPGGFTESDFGTQNWWDPVTIVPDDDNDHFFGFGNWNGDGPNSPEEQLVKVRFEVQSDGDVRSTHSQPIGLPMLEPPSATVEMLVEPGPNSGVHVPAPPGGGSRLPQTFVFVKREPKDGTSGQEGLALWYDDDQGQSGWVDLGTPTNPPCEIVGRPVAFSWYNGDLDRISVNVFCVARRGEGNNRWELYERYWSVDGNSLPTEGWAPWSNHGSPLWEAFDASKGQLLESNTKWRLTTALTWQLDGTDRVNVFGFADEETDRDGNAQPRRLVEYFWDGSVWNWGTPHEPPASGLGVKTVSAAWVNKDDSIRISVACRDELGGILERYYTIHPQQGWAGWFWNELTN